MEPNETKVAEKPKLDSEAETASARKASREMRNAGLIITLAMVSVLVLIVLAMLVGHFQLF